MLHENTVIYINRKISFIKLLYISCMLILQKQKAKKNIKEDKILFVEFNILLKNFKICISDDFFR